MNKRYTRLALFGVAAITLARLAAGCGDSNVNVNARTKEPSPSAPLAVATPTNNGKSATAGGANAQNVTIYAVETNEDGSYLKPRRVSVKSDVAATLSSGDRETLVREAITAMNALGKQRSPLPVGTTVKSVTFGGEKNTATLDLSREFKANFNGGNENESLALNSLLGVMGQFEGVRRVQILVDGEKIESLGGHQRMDSPMPIPQNVASNITSKNANE